MDLDLPVPGHLEARVHEERADHGEGWCELRWPSGGCIRLEHAAGRAEGIDRLEWTHDGPQAELTVGGTTFVLYPG